MPNAACYRRVHPFAVAGCWVVNAGEPRALACRKGCRRPSRPPSAARMRGVTNGARAHPSRTSVGSQVLLCPHVLVCACVSLPLLSRRLCVCPSARSLFVPTAAPCLLRDALRSARRKWPPTKFSFPVIFLLTPSSGRLRNTRLRVAVCLSLRVPRPGDEMPWYARGAEKGGRQLASFFEESGPP